MRTVRRFVLGLCVLLVLIIALVLVFPARWAAPLVQPRLRGVRLEGIHGLVWNGRVDRLAGPEGTPLGRVQWTLSRMALVGVLHLDVSFARPGWTASGHLERDRQGRPVWTAVHVRGDLAGGDTPATAYGVPRGQVALDLDRLVLQGNWPVAVDGRGAWRHARMQFGGRSVALGTLRATLDGTGGVVRGRVRDRGDGPLAVQADLALSPLGWRLAAQLRSRSGDRALHDWLAQFGEPDDEGAWHVERSGGLAQPPPKEIAP